MNIGFIGLGLMGAPMARNLAKAGHSLHVWSRRPQALAEVAKSPSYTVHESAAAVAAASEVVFTMVADSPDVHQVILGEKGVGEGGKPGLIVIDMSTIAPGTAREVAAALFERGIDFLDAPVSGGEGGAINATLTIMAGGEQQVFERVKPLLDLLGKSVTLIGGSGAGQVVKACNQVITGVGVCAVAEAINFAHKTGVDAKSMREVLLGGFAASRILELHGQRMIERNFVPGFKAWMHQKDLRIVTDTAHAQYLSLPTAAAALQLYNGMVGSGLGEDDTTAMLKLFEQMSGPAEQAAAMAQPVGVAARPMRVGFIGLGVMGNPMAQHLIKGGHEVSVWARREASAAEVVAAGATFRSSPTELAQNCEVVFTMITASSDVENVALGENGLIHGFARGSVLVDMSTIAPTMARKIAGHLAIRGIEFLDAPVSGGGMGAQNATLAIMAGGKPEVFSRIKPLFDLMGKTILHVGPTGAGQITKACNQMVMVAAIQAVAEAAHLAAANNVDFSRVMGAMQSGSAGSRVLDFFGDKMARRDFAAGIEARLHHKDYALIMEEAARAGAPLPISAQVWQQLNGLMALGWGKEDTSSLLRVLERYKH